MHKIGKGRRLISDSNMRLFVCCKFNYRSILKNKHVLIFLICVVTLMLIHCNFVDLRVKAQTDVDIADSNIRRPTTTQVIPEKYTSQALSNHNSSKYEIQRTISNGVAESNNLKSPLITNPSYTITNTTITFGKAFLEPEFIEKQIDVSAFVANNSYSILNGSDYK